MIKNIFKPVLGLAVIACLLSACSNLKYTYYNKHKVPYAAPREAKQVDAIPVKPFIAQTETALKENPQEKKNEAPEKLVAKKAGRKKSVIAPEQEKAPNGFDISKFFREHKYTIKAKSGDTIDNRTLMIALIVALILIVLALTGDSLLLLLWLAILIILVVFLMRYLDI